MLLKLSGNLFGHHGQGFGVMHIKHLQIKHILSAKKTGRGEAGKCKGWREV